MKIDRPIGGTTTLNNKYRYHKNDYNCPKCGGFLVTRHREINVKMDNKLIKRNHYFEGCERYPNCKFTRNI